LSAQKDAPTQMGVRYNSAMETACHLNHAQTVK
jgi:hypothetical protein